MDAKMSFAIILTVNGHHQGELFIDGQELTASEFLVQSGAIKSAATLNNGKFLMFFSSFRFHLFL